MKHYKALIFASFAIAALSACTDTIEPPSGPFMPHLGDGESVTLEEVEQVCGNEAWKDLEFLNDIMECISALATEVNGDPLASSAIVRSCVEYRYGRCSYAYRCPGPNCLYAYDCPYELTEIRYCAMPYFGIYEY